MIDLRKYAGFGREEGERKIAVYGTYEAKVPVRQRYWKHKVVEQRFWKRRKDGVKQRYWKHRDVTQRYWKETKRLKTVERSGRFEFSGKGKDVYKAVVKAHKIMPKGYVDVSAEKFLESPEQYGFEGVWIDREVESP